MPGAPHREFLGISQENFFHHHFEPSQCLSGACTSQPAPFPSEVPLRIDQKPKGRCFFIYFPAFLCCPVVSSPHMCLGEFVSHVYCWLTSEQMSKKNPPQAAHQEESLLGLGVKPQPDRKTISLGSCECFQRSPCA